jgi:predicted oxidoreductase
MSALPPKADMVQRRLDVRFVPKADIHERSVGESLVSNSFEMKIYIRDCRNTLSLYLTCRIQYNSRNFSCIRHPPDNKPV